MGTLCSTYNVEMGICTLEWVCNSFSLVIPIGNSNTGKVMLPDELRADVSIHGFCKWDTSAFFYIQISRLDTESYLCQTSVKAPETAEKDKKEKYLQPCLEYRCFFNPMVYSVDGIPGPETVAALIPLSLLLINKLKQ